MTEKHDLHEIARLAMRERGLLPDFSPEALAEAGSARAPEGDDGGAAVRDLTGLLFFSIDNDDSRDLDQLSYAERLPGGDVKLFVAVADVDVLARKGSAIDQHAGHNTTAVYTAGGVFTMLPHELCYDLTSLNQDEERLSMVVEMVVGADGRVTSSTVYRARVVNKAKLAYRSVGLWLESGGAMPERMKVVPGIVEQVRLQDEAAQRLKGRRFEQGALDLQTIEARPVFERDRIVDLEAERTNRAKELIENLMVAANGVTARYLEEKRLPSFRRVVREPERWPRLVDLAKQYGEDLPAAPDSKALSEFLAHRRQADPLRFPDLSLMVVKLMGKGEYVVEHAGQSAPGHFGLAVQDYAHSTAPNRRYPDLITQRLLKAALADHKLPYADGELDALASHCTQKEDDANKVERRLRKSAAALVLAPHVGERFDGIVSGASEKGTWVRIFRPPVEGKLVRGSRGLDVGDRVRVKLLKTDVENGFIDFARAGR